MTKRAKECSVPVDRNLSNKVTGPLRGLISRSQDLPLWRDDGTDTIGCTPNDGKSRFDGPMNGALEVRKSNGIPIGCRYGKDGDANCQKEIG